MPIEYEATFAAVNKDIMRAKLHRAGASLKKAEFLQKRKVFHLPQGHEIAGGWLRVRDEGDRITLSLKIVKNNATIEDQQEFELTIDSFETACALLTTIGCGEKGFQESLRERWELDGVEITIDEWPFLEPFVEIEGPDAAVVQAVAEKLGFDYSQAYFGAVDGLYSAKYGVPEEVINNRTPKLLFGMEENPFL